jgi:hypothetical protein
MLPKMLPNRAGNDSTRRGFLDQVMDFAEKTIKKYDHSSDKHASQ